MKTTTLLGLLLALASAVLGEEPSVEAEREPFVTVMFTTSTLSDYLGQNGLVFHDEPVIQPDLFLSFRGCWHVDVWASYARGSWWSHFGHEVDLTVGKCFSLGEWSLDLNLAYFAITGEDIGFADVVNPYAVLERPAGPLTVYVKTERYLPSRGDAPVSGWILRTGVRKSFQVGQRVTISPSGEVFWDSGAFGFSQGYLGRATLDVLFALTPSLSLGPVMKFNSPLESLDDAREASFAWGLKVVQSF